MRSRWSTTSAWLRWLATLVVLLLLLSPGPAARADPPAAFLRGIRTTPTRRPGLIPALRRTTIRLQRAVRQRTGALLGRAPSGTVGSAPAPPELAAPDANAPHAAVAAARPLALTARERGFVLRSLREGGVPDEPSFVRAHAPTNFAASVVRGLFAGRRGATRVARFVQRLERRYGPLTRLAARDVPNYDRFVVEKALALAEYHRTPEQVTETLVHARGSVDGSAIADRRILVQRWAPVRASASGALETDTAPSGDAVVIAPGYSETGANYLRLIDHLTRTGHEVWVMNQQWTGYSDGTPGAMDRAFGVVRDVAAVAGHVADETGESPVLLGNSLGGGPGVIGTMALATAGKIALRGTSVPGGLRGIAVSPFLAPSNDIRSAALKWIGRTPGLGRLAVSAALSTTMPTSSLAGAVYADGVAMHDAVGRPATMVHSQHEMDAIMAIARDNGLGGRLVVVQADADPVANADVVAQLARDLGEQAKRFALPGAFHSIHHDPRAVDAIDRGLQWVGEAARRQR